MGEEESQGMLGVVDEAAVLEGMGEESQGVASEAASKRRKQRIEIAYNIMMLGPQEPREEEKAEKGEERERRDIRFL